MLVKISWGITALAACASALIFVSTVGEATSAPQEAAGAAMAVAITVIPYVFTRCLEGLFAKA